MRVLIDTSAWADFLNGHPSLEGAAVAHLVESDHDICTCGVVIAEVFQGLRKARGRAQLVELFKALVYLEPSGVDLYFRAAEIYRRLRERGVTIRSTIDCLIAVLAEETGSVILARDRDLTSIVRSGLVETGLLPLDSFRS